jgi:hypothetical protein
MTTLGANVIDAHARAQGDFCHVDIPQKNSEAINMSYSFLTRSDSQFESTSKVLQFTFNSAGV